MSLVRVLVVDDSEVCRTALRELLEADGDVVVVAEAATGEAAIPIVRRLRPDLVALDIEMPGLGGLATIERIMAVEPTPILVVTAKPSTGTLVFEAVRRGALDLAAKPALWGVSETGAELRAQVRRLAQVPVVRHLSGRSERAERAAARAASEPAPAARPSEAAVTTARPPARAVGIVASAGGPAAIAAIVARLPADCSAAVAIVQHLPPGFTMPFGRYLATQTRLPIEVADARCAAKPGHIYLAPDRCHLVAKRGGTFAPEEGEPVSGHRPSGTVLLSSLADVYGADAVGVVLSGIGDDGASGLLRMRGAGALTIAQDEATSAVFGMPRAAERIGAAQLVLSVEAVAGTVARATSGERRSGDARGAGE